MNTHTAQTSVAETARRAVPAVPSIRAQAPLVAPVASAAPGADLRPGTAWADAVDSPRCAGTSRLWSAGRASTTDQSPLQAVRDLHQHLRIAGCRFDGDRLTADLLCHGIAVVTDRFGSSVPVTLHARADLCTAATVHLPATADR